MAIFKHLKDFGGADKVKLFQKTEQKAMTQITGKQILVGNWEEFGKSLGNNSCWWTLLH